MDINTLAQNNTSNHKWEAIVQKRAERAEIEVSNNNLAPVPPPMVSLAYFGGFSALIGILWLFSKIRHRSEKEPGLNLKNSSKIPCQNCRYFSGNFYLSCAVRPSDVLTKNAKDCSDYLEK
jgi:hypothetical protein